jgi:hypothetical protein
VLKKWQRQLEAFDAFCTYLAVKNHFTGKSYDFFKYGGKTKTTKESFLNRRDRLHFYKLSRRYSEEEYVDFLVANFIRRDKDKVWVGDLLDDKAEKTFREYMKRKESRSYTFSNDLDTLLKEHTPQELFKTGREYPPVFEKYCHGEIGLDTLVILDRYVGFVAVWNADPKINDDPLWEKISPLIWKYKPFVHYDSKKILEIMKEKLSK